MRVKTSILIVFYVNPHTGWITSGWHVPEYATVLFPTATTHQLSVSCSYGASRHHMAWHPQIPLEWCMWHKGSEGTAEAGRPALRVAWTEANSRLSEVWKLGESGGVLTASRSTFVGVTVWVPVLWLSWRLCYERLSIVCLWRSFRT